MVKHSVCLVRRLSQFDWFRGPQFVAAGLLLLYLLQCLWLVRVEMVRGILDSDQALRIRIGIEQWKGGAVAGTPESLRAEAATGIPSSARSGHLRVLEGYDQDRSPLYYLLDSAPSLLLSGGRSSEYFAPFLAAAPQIFFGLMLGASLWYVARRLYGNTGGYIALGLYCFSPLMIINTASSRSLGEMGAAWGAFGSIFTAIAVAHTLYAPREVVLWNWRRILLLGLSVALAVGNQFSLLVFAVMILPLMFWVAPVRAQAVLAIWISALVVAAMLVFAAYWFDPGTFWAGITHARWIDFEPVGLTMSLCYRKIFSTIVGGSPPLMLALPVALATYLGWKRARYFGNAAPLLVFVVLIFLILLSGGFPGSGFGITMLIFLFVFVAGVFADLLQSQHSELIAAGLWGLMAVSAAGNLWRLLHFA
jgi:hypothetical protein